MFLKTFMLPFYISKTVDDSKKERARVLMDKFGIRTLEKKDAGRTVRR